MGTRYTLPPSLPPRLPVPSFSFFLVVKSQATPQHRASSPAPCVSTRLHPSLPPSLPPSLYPYRQGPRPSFPARFPDQRLAMAFPKCAARCAALQGGGQEGEEGVDDGGGGTEVGRGGGRANSKRKGYWARMTALEKARTDT